MIRQDNGKIIKHIQVQYDPEKTKLITTTYSWDTSELDSINE